MTQHTVSLKTNLVVFGALMILLLATVAAAELSLGPWNTVVALAIAVTKAILIMLYFMHLKFSDRLTRVFAGAGFLWLAILIALSMCDYLTRGALGIDGK
jgi:cytochrome c oxidase subunit IV